MIHFIFSYSIIASQKLFYGHPEVTLLSCSTYSVSNKHFLVFSGREPICEVDFEAVVEQVSIFRFFKFPLYMLKQFRQKHWENHKHRYYKPACTDCTIMGILHSEEIKPSAGKMHFI